MAKTISKEQYLQLIGLLAVAEKHNGMLESILEAVREITGEEDKFGHSADMIYGSTTLDNALEYLDITVLKRPYHKHKK